MSVDAATTRASGALLTEQAIRRFISETFFVDEFASNDSFLQTGIVDSNGMMSLVVFIEQHFAIHIDDEELLPENLDSLDNLSRFIERKQRGAAPE